MHDEDNYDVFERELKNKNKELIVLSFSKRKQLKTLFRGYPIYNKIINNDYLSNNFVENCEAISEIHKIKEALKEFLIEAENTLGSEKIFNVACIQMKLLRKKVHYELSFIKRCKKGLDESNSRIQNIEKMKLKASELFF